MRKFKFYLIQHNGSTYGMSDFSAVVSTFDRMVWAEDQAAAEKDADDLVDIRNRGRHDRGNWWTRSAVTEA